MARCQFFSWHFREKYRRSFSQKQRWPFRFFYLLHFTLPVSFLDQEAKQAHFNSTNGLIGKPTKNSNKKSILVASKTCQEFERPRCPFSNRIQGNILILYPYFTILPPYVNAWSLTRVLDPISRSIMERVIERMRNEGGGGGVECDTRRSWQDHRGERDYQRSLFARILNLIYANA